MKRLLSMISLVLVVSMLLAIPVLAVATPRASSYFTVTSTFLEKVSGATFDVWFSVTGTGAMQEIGVKTIKVQRSSDKSTWTTMKTFSKDNYSVMTDENTAAHAGHVTYTGTAGYYYRAKVTFYARNSSGAGEYTMYTSTITVP